MYKNNAFVDYPTAQWKYGFSNEKSKSDKIHSKNSK